MGSEKEPHGAAVKLQYCNRDAVHDLSSIWWVQIATLRPNSAFCPYKVSKGKASEESAWCPKMQWRKVMQTIKCDLPGLVMVLGFSWRNPETYWEMESQNYLAHHRRQNESPRYTLSSFHLQHSSTPLISSFHNEGLSPFPQILTYLQCLKIQMLTTS